MIALDWAGMGLSRLQEFLLLGVLPIVVLCDHRLAREDSEKRVAHCPWQRNGAPDNDGPRPRITTVLEVLPPIMNPVVMT